MKIYVTGDTHQENNSEKLSEENFVEQKELTKDDFVNCIVQIEKNANSRNIAINKPVLSL